MKNVMYKYRIQNNNNKVYIIFNRHNILYSHSSFKARKRHNVLYSIHTYAKSTIIFKCSSNTRTCSSIKCYSWRLFHVKSWTILYIYEQIINKIHCNSILIYILSATIASIFCVERSVFFFFFKELTKRIALISVELIENKWNTQ